MRAKKVDRFGHTGKSSYEKEVYKDFLASKFDLDKTESDPVDINKTNESSVEEENAEPKGGVKKKSFSLKTKDFFSNNWFITLVGGFIVSLIMLILGGYIGLSIEQGVQSERISTIDKNITELNKQNKEGGINYNSLKSSFEVFRAEIAKDLEFIKKGMGI